MLYGDPNLVTVEGPNVLLSVAVVLLPVFCFALVRVKGFTQNNSCTVTQNLFQILKKFSQHIFLNHRRYSTNEPSSLR